MFQASEVEPSAIFPLHRANLSRRVVEMKYNPFQS